MKPSKKAQIKKRLDELCGANKGRLTPRLVIEDAKNPSSPLHGEFTWDMKKAAWEHWLAEARELIRSVRIEVRYETHFISAPCYVHDPVAGNAPGYRETLPLRTNKTIAREALQYELDRALGALERAQEVAQVLGLQNEVATFLNGLRQLRERKNTQAA